MKTIKTKLSSNGSAPCPIQSLPEQISNNLYSKIRRSFYVQTLHLSRLRDEYLITEIRKYFYNEKH